MKNLSVQFQAASDVHLYVVLLIGVGAALAGYGLWQLLRGRTRIALISLSAAVGAIAPAMLIDGLGRRGRGSRRGALTIARVAAVLATAAVVAAAVHFRDMTQAVWLIVLAFQIIVAVAVFYSAVYAYLGTARLAVLMALRCAAVLALLTVLFKPAVSVIAGTGWTKPLLPVLVDRSGSMATLDQHHTDNRYRRVVHALLSQRTRIEKHFQPLWYCFGQDLAAVGSLDELHDLQPEQSEGRTDIASAIRKAVADYSRDELAGVLLLSDGIHNVSSDTEAADAAAEATTAVYCAAVGSSDESALARRNIRILSVDAPRTVALNNVATVTVQVKMTSLAGQGAEVRLLAEGSDQPVDVAALRTSRNAQILTAHLKWTPKGAAAGSDGEAPKGSDIRKLRIEIPPKKDETLRADNSAELHVQVTQPNIRLLYIEGSIRPEYTFLRRRLAGDPNVEFMALIRINKNRFSSYGSIGGKKLMRLPTSDEDFALLDVLIIGDLDTTFLTSGQMRRIRRFVNDGGGLLMLGGHNSFGPGGYGGTDVEAALPVLMGRRSQRQESTAFLPRLTAAGVKHPIFAGLGDYLPTPKRDRPKEGRTRLPNLLGCVTVPRARATATVLAIHPTRRNAAGGLTVLAVQQYGAGRSAAFTADTTWKWYLPMRALGADSPYHRFWGQLIRWLGHVDTRVRKAGPSVMLRLDRSFVHAGKEVKLLARVADLGGRLTRTATVSCSVLDSKGASRKTPALSPSRDQGVFEGVFKPDRAGQLRLRVSATDDNGNNLGADELPLTVVDHWAEMDRLARNDELMAKIAAQSGGLDEDLARLPELIDRIINRGRTLAAAPKPRITRLYDFTALFLIFVVLMTGEWLLRRNWQLH